jgi:hypothetical protein
MDRHPHILNAASNLLGICFLIITGLALTKSNSRSFADEIAWGAAILFLLSLGLAYLAIRQGEDAPPWQGRWADQLFMLGVVLLTAATCVAAISLS